MEKVTLPIPTHSGKKLRAFLTLMGATALVFGFNLYRTVFHLNGISKDFDEYVRFIEPLKLHGTITTPHFVYPALVAISSAVFSGASDVVSGGCVVLIFQLLLAAILWKFWEGSLPASTSALILFMLTFWGMIVAPVPALMFRDHHTYSGYIAITTYNNPPVLLCRPLAFLNAILFIAAIANRRFSWQSTWACLLTLIMSALMKPNYALIMLPTSLLFAVRAYFRKDGRKLKFIALGTLLPGILVLTGQYIFTYVSVVPTMGASHIIFAPFVVYSNTSQYLLPKFIFSILFPLAVFVFYRERSIKDPFYLIGFLLFLFGVIQAYGFAESGARMYDGNFFWSAQLGLFVWFIMALRFVVREFITARGLSRWTPSLAVLTVLFSLHVISGVVWYYHQTVGPGAYW